MVPSARVVEGTSFSLPSHQQESFSALSKKLFGLLQDAFQPSARSFSAFRKEPLCSPQETAPKKYPTILCNVSKDKSPSIQYYFAKYPCFVFRLILLAAFSLCKRIRLAVL